MENHSIIDTEYISNKKGFTLVEVLIVILISAIIMGAIMISIKTGLHSSVGIDAKTTTQQDVRAALEMMALEIGMASYNPTRKKGIWRSATGDCSGAGNQSNRGIQIAEANSITVEMDINENRSITTGAGDRNEIISYNYESAKQRITRSTNCGPDFDLLGCEDANADGKCDNNGALRSVRVINDANTPVFRYFDSSGNETANIPDIRRIDITLVVESDIIDPMTKQRHRMTYSTSVIPRNHVTQ